MPDCAVAGFFWIMKKLLLHLVLIIEILILSKSRSNDLTHDESYTFVLTCLNTAHGDSWDSVDLSVALECSNLEIKTVQVNFIVLSVAK